MKKAAKLFAAFMTVGAAFIFSLVLYYNYALPDSFIISKNESFDPKISFGVKSVSNDAVSVSLTQNKSASFNSTLMLFGKIPVKNITFSTKSRASAVPCGEPFGIKMLTEGVIVSKLGSVENCCPAEEAGIKAGDIIISVNGEKITSNEQFGEIISKSKGEPLEMTVKRNTAAGKTEEKEIKLTPVYSRKDSGYKTGMWIRDSSAGIGTLTFYDPDTKLFASLGHPICDSDNGEIMPISEGDICKVSINGYTKSSKGNPGELEGRFLSGELGSASLNSQCGVFGELDQNPSEEEELPIAFKSEVKQGKAEILTTISGEKPKRYSVCIEEILSENSEDKNMVVRVIDKELLSKTGGIVQGMSGSPIIQDGMIVGAVTHVFVDDPEAGYGVFAETMYQQMIQNATNLNCFDLSA